MLGIGGPSHLNTSYRHIVVALSAFMLLAGSWVHAEQSKPRVSSINVCADQLILLLADPEQIVSLSKLATEAAGSYFADQAQTFPQNNGSAEDVLAGSPDLVLAGQFTVSYTPRLLEQLNVRVEKLPIANSLNEAMSNVRFVAQLLGQAERGEQVVTEMLSRLSQFPEASTDKPSAAVYEANGYTVGANTMRGEALSLAGWENVAANIGVDTYGSLSLEALVQLWPDAIIESPYAKSHYSRAQQLTQHPAIGKSGFSPLRISLSSSETVCAGPWSVDVVEQLIMARTEALPALISEQRKAVR